MKVQEQYKPQGLVIIASHLQNVGQGQVCSLLRAQKVNYTVVSNGRLSGDDSKGIPHAWLIDGNGKVVKEGHPEELRKDIDVLLQKDPHWIARGKKLESTGALKVSEGLKAGRPFSWALGECDALAKKDAKAKDEATFLKEQILAEADRALEDAKAAEEDDPAHAAELYADVKRQFGKTDQTAKAEARSKELAKDKAFQEELKAAKLAGQIREAAGQLKGKDDGTYDLESAANKPTTDQIKGALKQMQAKFGSTKTAAKLAAEMKTFGF